MECYVVWADIDADHYIVGPNAKITKFLKVAARRMMNHLCEGQRILGWVETRNRWTTQRTAPDVPRVQLQAPMPRGHLVFAYHTRVARAGGGQVHERNRQASVQGCCQEPQ